MKKIVLLLIAVALPAFVIAQNSAVDKLFNKYKGKKGVTTVQISPELFQVMNAMEIEEIEDCEIPLEQIKSVKILTIEDDDAFEGVNFYEEIKGELKTDHFAEVMTVDDGDETVRMWMKVDKAVIRATQGSTPVSLELELLGLTMAETAASTFSASSIAG